MYVRSKYLTPESSLSTVALNYQSEGRVMQLNDAKFRVNGNCGYVLKPQQMCKGNGPLYIYYCVKPLSKCLHGEVAKTQERKIRTYVESFIFP